MKKLSGILVFFVMLSACLFLTACPGISDENCVFIGEKANLLT